MRAGQARFMAKSSRLPGFYKKSIEERLEIVADWAGLTAEERAVLRAGGGLDPGTADHMIENVVGVYGLPLGFAANFLINGRDVLVPMVIEEPSVVAGASFIARLARQSGGFSTSSTEPHMIAQIQVLDVDDRQAARLAVLERRQDLLDRLNGAGGRPASRHSRALDLEVRLIDDSPAGPMLVVHLIYDTGDAMGANIVNTAAESLAPIVEEITGGRALLRILSNLADRRLARAKCVIPAEALAFAGFSGEQVVQNIVEAQALAEVDPYRAATHNKGIMNGVDAVVIATGNDWRAIEAGAHAYAARTGRYTALSRWSKDAEGNLAGELEMPLAVGIVGGATRVHPLPGVLLKIIGVSTARELAEIIVAVGLAQNLAAIRALATEGIQRGHMSLHARQVAIAAGAAGDRIRQIADRLVAERNIRLDRAQELLGIMNYADNETQR
ncbi:MAG: hydroxymethylglutaryl-CoA reductase, degradative [Anaerolineae bacterium]